MKKILQLLTVTFSFATLSFAQTFYSDYQDGLVVFQLKESEKIIPSIEKEVSFRGIDLFDEIIQKGIEIEEVLRLHPRLKYKDNKLSRTYQIRLVDFSKVDEVVRILSEQSSVAYAELKDLHKLLTTPNDLGPDGTQGGWGSITPQNNQWYLHKIQAQDAWDFSTGSASIKVAVTDDAFKVDHPDLVNKMLPGRDVVGNNNDPSPCGSTDGFHGTHVAGTVGAETDNGIGIASIGWNVSIIPVKIANCSAQLSGGYDGVIWSADNDADVINMSWGGPNAGQYGLNIINYAHNAGAILVAAAGNDGTNNVLYPAAYANVIAVGATTITDAKASFSQYGPEIDVLAPGAAIRSTNHQDAYAPSQGTSMASPIVAGLLGLMKSYAPEATNEQIIECLKSGCDNVDAQNSSITQFIGSGRINAYKSMQCLEQYSVSYQYDAGITEVISPEGNYCGGNFVPEVVLRNFGEETLTSVKINYGWGGNTYTYDWTGSLSNGQTAQVTLPQQSSASGNFTFMASTSNPNGQQDENSSNDSSTSAFNIDEDGEAVEFTLTLDCFGSEVSWEIRNQETNSLEFSGSGYADNTSGEVIVSNFCISAGCYEFIIQDEYGDGMYGAQWQSCSINGDYKLEDKEGNILFQMTAPNADFGAEAVHDFCINETPSTGDNDQGDNTASTKDFDPSKNIVVFPNPSSGKFNLRIEGWNKEFNILVKDVLGRTVIKPQTVQAHSNQNVEIDLTPFNKGVYFIMLDGEELSFTRRVIVK